MKSDSESSMSDETEKIETTEDSALKPRPRTKGDAEILKLKAKGKERKDEIVAGFAEDDRPIVNKALRNLGFQTETIQEAFAGLAMSDTTYPEYLAVKQKILDSIRKEVVKVYTDVYKQYKMLGFPKHDANKIAKDVAQAYKKSQMVIFDTYFPHSGQKAERKF